MVYRAVKLKNASHGLGCLMEILHWQNNGLASIASAEQGWLQLGGLRTGRPVPKKVPNRKIKQDSYCSINTVAILKPQQARRVERYRDRILEGQRVSVQEFYWAKSHRQPNSVFWRCRRDSSRVRWLNAVWVDCDCHTLTLTEAVELSLRLLASRQLPLPSFGVHSGRGLWWFWLLADPESGGRPYPAWVGLRQRVVTVNQAIVCALPEVKADPQATNVTTCCRIPGSVNSRSGAIVQLLVPLLWPLPKYTIEQLEFAVGERVSFQSSASKELRPYESDIYPLDIEHLEGEIREGPVPVADQSGGAQALKAARRRLLKPYEAIRDAPRLLQRPYGEGCRNSALFLLCLHGMKARLECVIDDARQLAANCEPPLIGSEVRATLKSTKKLAMKKDYLPPSYESIAESLQWTESDMEAVGLARRKHPRTEKMVARRELLSELLELPEAASSLRRLKAHLQKQGIDASIATISRDLKALKQLRDDAAGNVRH